MSARVCQAPVPCLCPRIRQGCHGRCHHTAPAAPGTDQSQAGRQIAETPGCPETSRARPARSGGRGRRRFRSRTSGTSPPTTASRRVRPRRDAGRPGCRSPEEGGARRSGRRRPRRARSAVCEHRRPHVPPRPARPPRLLTPMSVDRGRRIRPHPPTDGPGGQRGVAYTRTTDWCSSRRRCRLREGGARGTADHRISVDDAPGDCFAGQYPAGSTRRPVHPSLRRVRLHRG